jgi:photosynthetic reaction center cytochrome c subunit
MQRQSEQKMKLAILRLAVVALGSVCALVVIISPRAQKVSANQNKFAPLYSALGMPQPEQTPGGTQEKTIAQEGREKNVKLLGDLPVSQFIPVMNFFAASMGRRCNFCHVNNNGQWDYASDAKPEKNTAREMIKMVLDLHKKPFTGATEISCYTCHRGQNNPQSLPVLPLPTPVPRPAAATTPAPGAAPTGSPTAQASPSATPALPSADEIFSKYIAAIGGQANIDKLKSRTLKGSVAQPNGTVALESMQAAPDKFYITATTPGGAFERGFNGKVGWEKGPRGIRELNAVEVGQLQSSLGLFKQINLKQQFTSTRVRPAQKIGDRPVVLVIGTAADNHQERLYFDAETGLLLRRISYMQTMIGLIPTQLDFEDYRDVDGVKLPFSIRVSTIEVGNPITALAFSEMKLNVPVDDSKFNMPPAPVKTPTP